MSSNGFIGKALGLVLACGSTALAQKDLSPTGGKPPEQPAVAPEVKADPALISTADELLTKLETADKDLKGLQADILYDRTFALVGDEQLRTGKLAYVDNKQKGPDEKPLPGSRKFAIHFKTLKLGANPPIPQDKVMIFDGEWLIEKMPSDKQMVKRQITKPGQGFDPLKVGEGPFPLPIGQKKDDMLKKFKAELLPAALDLKANDPTEQAKMDEFVKGSYQLKLTPLQGDQGDFKEIRLWYRPDAKGTLLPRMARTVNQQDDTSVVQMINVKLNEQVPAEMMDTNAPAGWKVDVQELQGENRR